MTSEAQESIPRPTAERILDAAEDLFAERGYTATSLAELLDGMGIGRSSIYAAYGDKRSLFVEALELFGLE